MRSYGAESGDQCVEVGGWTRFGPVRERRGPGLPSACAEMGLAKALTKSALREEDDGAQVAEEFSFGGLAVRVRTQRLVQPTDCGRLPRDPYADLWNRVLPDSDQ